MSSALRTDADAGRCGRVEDGSIEVEGRIHTWRDGVGDICRAALVGADGRVHEIELDARGENLAELAAGRQVRARGMLSMQATPRRVRRWLRILTHREVDVDAAWSRNGE